METLPKDALQFIGAIVGIVAIPFVVVVLFCLAVWWLLENSPFFRKHKFRFLNAILLGGNWAAVIYFKRSRISLCFWTATYCVSTTLAVLLCTFNWQLERWTKFKAEYAFLYTAFSWGPSVDLLSSIQTLVESGTTSVLNVWSSLSCRWLDVALLVGHLSRRTATFANDRPQRMGATLSLLWFPRSR